MKKGTFTFADAKALSSEERTAKEKELRQANFQLRLQKATGQLENPITIQTTRRDVARLHPAASQARLAAGKASAKKEKG